MIDLSSVSDDVIFGEARARAVRIANDNLSQLREWIRRRGGAVTARQLQASNKNRYPNVEVARLVLDALAAAGHAVWLPAPSSKLGGRPTRRLAFLDYLDLSAKPAKTDVT